MELKNLNPWNWFSHEEAGNQNSNLPTRQEASLSGRHFPSGLTGSSGGLWQLHREMDRLFDETFRHFGLSSRFGSNQTDSPLANFVPSLNVASNEQGYSITLEAPGLTQEDITLDLRDHTLFIRGEKHQEQEAKDQHYYRIERHYGQFQRVLELPADVDLDKISASMKNGVLTLSLPRSTSTPNSNQRSINIQSQD